ncbi:MAG: hypothetical protein MMC33_009481 [Icmadophila ericetorum]|nr:hypothetical protein [Icmadophila ericetorum]
MSRAGEDLGEYTALEELFLSIDMEGITHLQHPFASTPWCLEDLGLSNLFDTHRNSLKTLVLTFTDPSFFDGCPAAGLLFDLRELTSLKVLKIFRTYINAFNLMVFDHDIFHRKEFDPNEPWVFHKYLPHSLKILEVYYDNLLTSTANGDFVPGSWLSELNMCKGDDLPNLSEVRLYSRETLRRDYSSRWVETFYSGRSIHGPEIARIRLVINQKTPFFPSPRYCGISVD